MASRTDSATPVQAVAVRPAGHLDTCAAVATASGLALLRADPADPAWELWLSGSFTKSVRDASRKSRWGSLMATADALGLERSQASCGDAIAVAFAPMPYDAMPRALRSLRVAGIDEPLAPQSGPMPKADPAGPLLVPLVRLSPEAAMSTGKAAAQTAHAVCLWLLASSEQVHERWARRPHVRVEVAAEDRPEVIEVRDNGLTEVEAGTLTATVQMPPGGPARLGLADETVPHEKEQ